MNVSFNPSHHAFHALKGSTRLPSFCGRGDHCSPTASYPPRLAASWRVDAASALLTCEWTLVGKADDTRTMTRGER